MTRAIVLASFLVVGAVVAVTFVLPRPSAGTVAVSPSPTADLEGADASPLEDLPTNSPSPRATSVASTTKPPETTRPDEAPSPQRSPTPTPTPAETLAPGRHSTQRWLPYMSFEGRPGWRIETDSTLQVNLTYADGRARLAAINDAYPPCPLEPTSEIEDHSAADLVSYLERQPGYDVTAAPTSVGGLDGWLVEGSSYNGCGTFVIGGSPPVTINLNPDFSLIALDEPEGKTIVIYWEAQDDAARAEVMELIKSIQFGQHVMPVAPQPERGAGKSVLLEGLEYTARDGWAVNEDDRSMSFELGQGLAEIELTLDAYPPCNLLEGRDAPRRAADFAVSLSSNVNVDVAVSPVSLGGLDGWRIEGAQARSTPDCRGSFAYWFSGIPTFVWLDPTASMIVLDGFNGETLLIYWLGADPESKDEAASVVASFVFDVPPPQPPPACMPSDSGSTSTTPPSEPDISAETMLWTASDGTPGFVVVLTNNSTVVWRQGVAVVRLYDACRRSTTQTLNLGELIEPGQSAVGTRRFTAFTPVSLEAVAVSKTPWAPNQATYQGCGEPTFSSSDDGNVLTTSQFSMGEGNVSDFEIEAVAIYRNSSHELIGVDTTLFERRYRSHSDTTSFEIEHVGGLADLAAVETYCRVRRSL